MVLYEARDFTVVFVNEKEIIINQVGQIEQSCLDLKILVSSRTAFLQIEGNRSYKSLNYSCSC